MMLSLNVILDNIKYLNPEVCIEDTAIRFKGVKLLTQKQDYLFANYLYLCNIGDLEEMSEGLTTICITNAAEAGERAKRLGCSVVLNTKNELALVFNELQGLFLHFSEWDNNLQLSLIRNKGIQDLIDLSESVLGNPVAVVDPSLKRLAYTKNIDSDDPIFGELVELGYHTEETFKKLNDYHYFSEVNSAEGFSVSTATDIKKYTSAVKVLRIGGLPAGSAVMIFPNIPVSEGLLELFDHLISKIMHYFVEAQRQAPVGRHAYEYFLIDLIEGRIKKYEISERSKYIELPVRNGFNLIKFTLNRTEEEIKVHEREILSQLLPGSNPTIYGKSIVILKDLGSRYGHRSPAASACLEKIERYLEGSGTYCGISERLTELTAVSAGFFQATQAIEYGNRCKNSDFLPLIGKPAGEGRIYWYSDYSVYCAIDKYDGQGSPQCLCSQLLLALLEQDRKNNTDNLRVLYTFLRNEMKYTETAAALHMHRNNVIYRIDRIKEKLGIELNDPELRFQLLLSFKTLELNYA